VKALKMVACKISLEKEELKEGVSNLRRGTRRSTFFCVSKKSMKKELE
jgi:hypothetical protein